jgi:hypothetical protein
VQGPIDSMRWMFVFCAGVTVVGLAMVLWRILRRGPWKIKPGVSLHIAASPKRTWGSAANGESTATGDVVQAGPFGLRVKRTVLKTTFTANSADEIPQEILDALSPEQRKMVLDRLPGGAKGGGAGSSPSGR